MMRFLSVSDRKEACLVNKLWYEASLAPVLQRDMVITFFTSSTEEKGLSGLSRRKSPNLVLSQIDSSMNPSAIVLKSCEHLCENLTSLSLKGVDITESSFVSFASHCFNLISLDLSSCNCLFMSGKILERESDVVALKKALKNVKELNLASIRFLSDATFNRITSVCPKVQKLSLASAVITFNSNAYYPEGTEILASKSVFSFRNILQFLRDNSSQITSLNLSRTALINHSLVEIFKVEGLQLEEIILVGCKDISTKGVVAMCELQKSIQSLDLSCCADITDAAVCAIQENLNQLVRLKLTKCRQITDASVSKLHLLPSLTSLDLSECYQLLPKAFNPGLCTSSQARLTHLNLNCCTSMDNDVVLGLCKSLPTLQHLDLGSCFAITDISVQAIAKNLKYLRYLRLAWCKEVTDLGLLGIIRNDSMVNHSQHGENGKCRCTRKHNINTMFRSQYIGQVGQKLTVEELETLKKKKNRNIYSLSNISGLTSLDLSSCSKLTDISIINAVQFKELKSLHLSMIHSLTDESLKSIANNNPSLEELALAQCYNFTDKGVEAVTENLTRLTSLNVSSCDKLTDHSLELLRVNCDRLKTLDVSLCGGMSLEGVERLEAHAKHLKSVQKRLVGGAL